GRILCLSTDMVGRNAADPAYRRRSTLQLGLQARLAVSIRPSAVRLLAYVPSPSGRADSTEGSCPPYADGSSVLEGPRGEPVFSVRQIDSRVGRGRRGAMVRIRELKMQRTRRANRDHEGARDERRSQT